MPIEVMAFEAVMSVEVMPRESVLAGKSAVRPTGGVLSSETTATAEMPTTTAAVPAATAAAACVRRRATGEDQDSDQCSQPN